MKAFFLRNSLFLIFAIININVFANDNFIDFLDYAETVYENDSYLQENDFDKIELFNKEFKFIIDNYDTQLLERFIKISTLANQQQTDMNALGWPEYLKTRKTNDIIGGTLLGGGAAMVALSGLTILTSNKNYDKYLSSKTTSDASKYRTLTKTSDIFTATFLSIGIPSMLTSIYFFISGPDREAIKVTNYKNHIYKQHRLLR